MAIWINQELRWRYLVAMALLAANLRPTQLEAEERMAMVVKLLMEMMQWMWHQMQVQT